MTELQAKLLEMLKEFHNICVRENLRYYLLGGTALGAVRHQGFIPWDDDVDVGMPRPDYEKLKEISEKTDFGKYCFEYPSADKEFVYSYGKMYDTTTTLIENTRYKTKRGIYLDIFPLDGVGNTYEESFAYFRKVEKKVNLLSAKTCAWRRGRKLYKNLALLAMRIVPEFILSQSALKAEIDELSRRFDFDQSIYVDSFSDIWDGKKVAQRAWFGNPTLMTFESYKFFGPERPEEYLTAVYGDWRKLPPKEKQVSHHDYIECDLSKSYLKE